jgi:porin
MRSTLLRFVSLLLTTTLLAPCTALKAQDQPTESLATALTTVEGAELKSERRDSNLFSREWLESQGIGFRAGYRAEMLAKARGGVGRFGSNYLGSADLAFDFSLTKMKVGRGHFVLSMQSLHGRGITDRKIGTVQAVSNLEESSFAKVVEAYYSDSYAGGRLAFKVGRHYADADFNATENAADFLNSSYGLIPTVPMPAFPTPQLGASIWVALRPWLSVGGGAFQGDRLDMNREGQSAGRLGVFTVGEVKVSPSNKRAALHGSYRAGIWRQGNGTYLAASSPDSRPIANYGFYLAGDQWFRPETSGGGKRGPGAFLQVGWSPEDRNQINRYVGGGIAWEGLIPGRTRDAIGIGITTAWVSGAPHTDNITEVFYKARINSRFTAQPDIQYSRRPGGSGRNALIAGVRIGLEF